MASKVSLQTSYSCVDCTSQFQEHEVSKLHCLKHFVCNACFPKRFHTCDKKEDTLKCSICYDINISPGVYIFVDDSKIWIGAKALQSKLKRFKTKEDHRVRIDIGKLTDVLAGGRAVDQGVLYGSEPPPVDSVWTKIKERGWRVETDKKHKLTGKEKKVDTRLVADVTELAIKTPINERTTIVLVTGDADVIPAIQKVMAEAHWSAEVCMWKHAMSQDLSRFARNNHQRVEIKYLDNFLDKVSFTNMRFDISNPQVHRLVNMGGVVFSVEERGFSRNGDFYNHIPTKSWLNRLESIAQWPFQYYWFNNLKSKIMNDLVVVFKPDQQLGDFDITQFLEDVKLESDRDHYCLPSIAKVQPFLQYKDHYFKEPIGKEVQKFDAALEQVGIYNDEEALAGSDNDVVYEADPNNNWKTYRRQLRRPQRLRQQYSESCLFKFNCKFGTRCQYKHSEEEKSYFKGRPEGRGNPIKVSLCRYFTDIIQTCNKTKEECEFAHGEEDAWCLNCLVTGHSTDKCPKKIPK